MFFSENGIAGHRGWPTRFPDNTAAGIRAALDAVGSIETDVRRSADGVLVLSHDPVIAGRVVCETTWNALAEVDVGGGHRPLSLRMLLTEVAGSHPLNLEVKNSPSEPGFEADHRIALDTAQMARPDDLLSSFHWPSMDAVRASHPEVATGLLLDESVSMSDALDHAVGLGHVAVIPNWRLLMQDLEAVALARSRGIRVVSWTVNDPSVARALFEAGVAVIITDDPGGMRTALTEDEDE